MNDKLSKKLALFYHPLFQSILGEWNRILHIKDDRYNIVHFSEANIRIQKVLIEEFEIQNSLASALTDWLREINNLRDKDFDTDDEAEVDSSKRENTQTKEVDPKEQILEYLKEIKFETVADTDDYMSLIDQHHGHQALKYTYDLLSSSGFGKFLFDLCASWCEDLDLELFIFFQISLIMQMTEKDKVQTLVLKKGLDLTYLPAAFHTQMKMMKGHFQRYKKVDVFTFQSFYEWNYLPVRLTELKKKCKEFLNTVFPEQEFQTQYFETVFEKSIAIIKQRNLEKPTTEHFEFGQGIVNITLDPNFVSSQTGTNQQQNIQQSSIMSKYGFQNISQASSSAGFSKSGFKGGGFFNFQNQMEPKSLDDSDMQVKGVPTPQNERAKSEQKSGMKRVPSGDPKLSMPVLGKSINMATQPSQSTSNPQQESGGGGEQQPSSEDNNRVHTIKSIVSFMDPSDEIYNPIEQMLYNKGAAGNNLYPIWEREASECNSTGTIGTSTRRKGSIGGPQYAGWLDEISPQNLNKKHFRFRHPHHQQQQFIKAHFITIDNPGMVKTEASNSTSSLNNYDIKPFNTIDNEGTTVGLDNTESTNQNEKGNGQVSYWGKKVNQDRIKQQQQGGGMQKSESQKIFKGLTSQKNANNIRRDDFGQFSSNSRTLPQVNNNNSNNNNNQKQQQSNSQPQKPQQVSFNPFTRPTPVSNAVFDSIISESSTQQQQQKSRFNGPKAKRREVQQYTFPISQDSNDQLNYLATQRLRLKGTDKRKALSNKRGVKQDDNNNNNYNTIAHSQQNNNDNDKINSQNFGNMISQSITATTFKKPLPQGNNNDPQPPTISYSGGPQNQMFSSPPPKELKLSKKSSNKASRKTPQGLQQSQNYNAGSHHFALSTLAAAQKEKEQQQNNIANLNILNINDKNQESKNKTPIQDEKDMLLPQASVNLKAFDLFFSSTNDASQKNGTQLPSLQKSGGAGGKKLGIVGTGLDGRHKTEGDEDMPKQGRARTSDIQRNKKGQILSDGQGGFKHNARVFKKKQQQQQQLLQQQQQQFVLPDPNQFRKPSQNANNQPEKKDFNLLFFDQAKIFVKDFVH